MAYRRHNKGVPWRRCDRCGFWYPKDELVRQKGLWVDTVNCRDDLSREQALRDQDLRLSPKGEGEDKFAPEESDYGEY